MEFNNSVFDLALSMEFCTIYVVFKEKTQKAFKKTKIISKSYLEEEQRDVERRHFGQQQSDASDQ